MMQWTYTFVSSVAAIIAVTGPACDLPAATLYVANTDRDARSLREVNQQTGQTTQVNPGVPLPLGSWSGLSSVPNVTDYVIAVHNPTPARFEDPQLSRLARINIETGQATLLPLFDDTVLGFSDPFSTAVAVSVLRPTIAIVAGFEKPAPGRKFLYEVDVQTGQALGAAVQVQGRHRLGALAFSSDGSTLYGANQQGMLVTVDFESGSVTTLGDPGLTDFITGLAFDPDEARLFAIDGGFSDRLVELDPSNGSVVSTIGRLRINGPEGLAFVPAVPEPTGSSLVMIALAVYALAGLAPSAAMRPPNLMALRREREPA